MEILSAILGVLFLFATMAIICVLFNPVDKEQEDKEQIEYIKNLNKQKRG